MTKSASCDSEAQTTHSGCLRLGVHVHVHKCVIWSFVIPWFHTAYFWFSLTLWFSCLCGWKCTFAGASGCLVACLLPVMRPELWQLYCTLLLFLWIMAGWSSHLEKQLVPGGISCDCLTCSVWACLVDSVTVIPDVNMITGCANVLFFSFFLAEGGTEVNWGHGRGFLELGQRSFDVWCHLQAFVCLSALLCCFRGCGWGLAWTAVVWLSL